MQNGTQNIDFSAITSSRFYESDKESAGKSPTQHLKKLLLFVPLIFTGIGIPVFIIIAILYISKSNKEANERRKSIADFATANGYSYEKVKFGFATESDNILSENLDLPYNGVTNVQHLDVIKGKIQGCDFSYSVSMVFKETRQAGDDRHTQNPVVLFTINLPVQLPRIFLNSKFNNMTGFEPKTDNFISSEAHQLEGDFPAYYDVKIENNEHIDMYTTLTPDVMDTLKRNNKYDVWLNGSQLIMITFGDYSRYFAGAPEAFNNAEVLMQEIDKIARPLRQY